jgi:hypothetical protein
MAGVTWRSALLQVHRWFGIGGGLLFVAWFASGIVMMYRRIPELDARERLARLPTLDATAWLYLDPGGGAIARKEERLTRLNRWLYHGLHSLDFPRFYASRPLWDVVVIALSLGGLVLSATTLLPGWRGVARALLSRGER